MRLIDAKWLIEKWNTEAISRREMYQILKDAPSIDIVMCRECKWADWYKTVDSEQFCYCMETDTGGRTADDYCSYGERG